MQYRQLPACNVGCARFQMGIGVVPSSSVTPRRAVQRSTGPLHQHPLLSLPSRNQKWRGWSAQHVNERPVVVRSTSAEEEGIFTTSPRESRLFTLMSTVTLELLLTGGLFWSPLVCSLLFILLSPSGTSLQQSKEEAVRQAVDEVKREAAARVPVTPPESAEFMNRLMAEMWVPFVVPQTLRDNLSAWQEKARLSAPKGWTIELTDFSLGVHSPHMSNFQVFNDSVTGRMQAMECDMDMTSSSMRVVVRGSGPLGDFRATVSGMSMKGKVRVLPMMEQRMLLWSFLHPPDAQIKLQVKGPLIGEREVPQFSFMRSAILSGIQDTLVEPRRAAASLDYENIGQQALDTNLNIFVESVNNLGTPPSAALANPPGGTTTDVVLEPESSGTQSAKESTRPASSSPVRRYGWPSLSQLGARVAKLEASTKGSTDSSSRTKSGSTSGSPSGATTKGSESSSGGSNASANAGAHRTVGLFKQLRNRTGSAVLVNATNMNSKVERRSATRLVNPEGRAAIDELLKVDLGDKDGIINIQVRDASRKNRVGGQPVFGRARLHVAAAKDGSTLMWCLGKDKKPLARRWLPAMGPWQVTVPLENPTFPDASITLALSTDPWTYAQVAPMSSYKTPGARTVVLQVLEGRDLPANDWAGTSDPYVQLLYDQRTYNTRTLFNSQQPLWNETFVFLENPSLLTRTVRLAVRDNGVADKTEALGIATLNLDMALEATIQDRWLQLGGSESGELRVRMAVVAGAPESPSVQQMVALLGSSDFTQASVPTLQVVAVAARNLPPRPAALRLPSPNRSTYCGLTFGGTKQVTPVAMGSQNPTWNFAALFPLAVSQPPPPLADMTAMQDGKEEHEKQVAPTTPPSTASPTSATKSASSTTQTQPAKGPTTSLAKQDGSSSGAASAALGSASKSGPSISPGSLIPGANRLKLEVFDVDMKPPNNSLGYVEVDANLTVPQPGDNWEQWLSLKGNNRGAEVLVRIAHLAQFSGNQGSLPNPLEARPSAAATMNILQHSRPVTSTPITEPPRAEKVLVDSFSEQVRLANLKAVQAGEGLRKDLAPKLQSWLSGVTSAITAQQLSIMAAQKKRQEEQEEQDRRQKKELAEAQKKEAAAREGLADPTDGATAGSNGTPPVGSGSVIDSIAASAKAREARDKEAEKNADRSEAKDGSANWLKSLGGGLQGWKFGGGKGGSK